MIKFIISHNLTVESINFTLYIMLLIDVRIRVWYKKKKSLTVMIYSCTYICLKSWKAGKLKYEYEDRKSDHKAIGSKATKFGARNKN